MKLIRTTLGPDESWDCEVCRYPLDPGETALTTDPEDLPNVYCGTECAKRGLNVREIEVKMGDKC